MTAVADLPLTRRQREVLALRLAGRGRRQIAEAMGISVRTVHEEFDRARVAMGAADEVELLVKVDRCFRISA